MADFVLSKTLKKAGIVHGFSERGQADGSAFGSLNVKSDAATPDDPHKVQRVREHIIKKAGGDPQRVVFLRSLPHGNTVFDAHSSDIGQEIDGYDAIVTKEHITIGLSVADCVPILLYEPDKNIVAAIHAGWRGTESGVVSETLKYLQNQYHVDPSKIQAVIGPAICGDCYEVGDEVAGLFDSAVLKREKGKKAHLNLKAENSRQLKLHGVESIEDLGLCTLELHSRFFSVRHDGQTGRFMAFISPHSA